MSQTHTTMGLRQSAEGIQSSQQNRKINQEKWGAEKQTMEQESAKQMEQEGMFSFVRGVFEGRSKAEVLGDFNRKGKVKLSNFDFDREDGSITMTGLDGRTSRIPGDIATDMYRSHYGLKPVSRGTGSASTKLTEDEQFEVGAGLQEFGEYFDITLKDEQHPEGMSKEKFSAVKAGLRASKQKGGPTYADIGSSLGLRRRTDVVDAARTSAEASGENVQDTIERARGLFSSRLKGVSEGELKKIEEAARLEHEAASKFRELREKQQQDDQRLGSLRLGSANQPGQGQPGQVKVHTPQELDSNKNGKVDARDELVQAALHADENPDLYSPQEREEAAAILKVYRKLTQQSATKRLTGVR